MGCRDAHELQNLQAVAFFGVVLVDVIIPEFPSFSARRVLTCVHSTRKRIKPPSDTGDLSALSIKRNSAWRRNMTDNYILTTIYCLIFILVIILGLTLLAEPVLANLVPLADALEP
jgi:hypothetical protein